MINAFLNRIRIYNYRRSISSKSIEDVFTSIYKKRLWFSNRESSSGAGSTLIATEALRQHLRRLIQDLECNMLLDIGCGDFNWMKEVDLPCRYVGADIVKTVIDANALNFGNEKRSFLHLNAVDDPLPKHCDVVLCREVLFHLSFLDGLRLINNVLDSGAKYFIATTNDHVLENVDIKTGEFRNINLHKPPYNFPRYETFIPDDRVSKNRILGVWDIAGLKQK